MTSQAQKKDLGSQKHDSILCCVLRNPFVNHLLLIHVCASYKVTSKLGPLGITQKGFQFPKDKKQILIEHTF